MTRNLAKSGNLSWLLCAAVFFAIGWTGRTITTAAEPAPSTATFRHFAYHGHGPAAPAAGQYANPIQPGYFPDPSLCRVGDDYYMVHSTFAYFPGLPLFHSRDLVNWTQLGNVLDRPSQLKLDGADVSGGLYAPSIRFHDGTFYVVCTNVSGGGNFVVTATNPAGPWSEPNFMPAVNGIDPSLFFDDDGAAYLVHNGPPPDNQSLYDGHRAIWLYAFDPAARNVKPDTGKIIVNGGTDLAKKPVWIEGPHLIKKDGWYYLIAAEGGTGPQHSEVAFRSKNVWGPYAPWADNPVLTQRDLPKDRANPISCTGHADFVQTPAGEWWAVFLGCRPYLGDGTYTNLGRETFLMPVDWSGEWPCVTQPGQVVPAVAASPKLAPATQPGVGQMTDETWTDDFTTPVLRPEWLFLRVPAEPWSTAGLPGGGLAVQPRAVPLAMKQNPSLLARRVRHGAFEATVAVDCSAATAPTKAGLVVVQSGTHYLFVGVHAGTGGKPTVFIETDGTTKNAAGPMTPVTQDLLSPTPRAEVRIACDGRYYTCSVRPSGGAWTPVGEAIDGKFLSTAEAGGFVGTVVGPFAVQD